jgi:hypothetical protein
MVPHQKNIVVKGVWLHSLWVPAFIVNRHANQSPLLKRPDLLTAYPKDLETLSKDVLS